MGGTMQVAVRMDLSRTPATGTDGRIFALALASGIAGLFVTYPTATIGNAATGEWMGKFEVRPPHLAMPAISPNTAMARIGANTAHSSGALAPSPNSESYGRGFETRLAAPSIGRLAVKAAGPLDAVRIALPPASPELEGAMPAEATLDRIAARDHAPPAPTPASQPLAASASPAAALSDSAPGALSGTPSFDLSSAPREVREFDLAKLGPAKSAARSVMRSSGNTLALAASKAAPRPQALSKVARTPDRIVGDHIIHVAGLSLDGAPSGNLQVRISINGELSLKLADLLAPLQNQMAPDAFERLANSPAASEYITFTELRAAGFDVRYDAGNDRLTVFAQP